MQTTPSEPAHKYAQRRQAIRDTFLPELEALPDTAIKFVVGRTADPSIMRAFAQELKKFQQSFLRLDMEVWFCHVP